MSGEVNIKNCDFVNNSVYKHHGAAIHYTSNTTTLCSQNLFTISNCNSTYNEGAQSLVYIENKFSEYSNIIFHGSNFCHNRGISIHVINQKFFFNGKVLFQNNTAENGAGPQRWNSLFKKSLHPYIQSKFCKI